jgi:hypothetical protein
MNEKEKSYVFPLSMLQTTKYDHHGKKVFYIFFFKGCPPTLRLSAIFFPNTPARLLYRFSNAVSIDVSDLFFCHFLEAFPFAFSLRVLADQPVCTVLKF